MREKSALSRHRVTPLPRLTWLANPWFQLALILAVAAFFRLWQIESIPPGLFGDEAAEGLDALDVLAGRGQVFFPTNYGREGLYIWLVAGSIKLFGATPLAVRLPAVLIGILTCVVAWWLAREWGAVNRGTGRLVDWETGKWVDGEKEVSSASLPTYQLTNLPTYLPLLVGLYLATAYWHVHFSRFSQRTILTPFAVGLAAAAFWRGVNLGRTRWFLVAGAGLGLALHSYSVGRFFPVFLAIFLLLQFTRDIIGRGRAQTSADDRSFLRLSAFIRILFSKPWRDILLMFLIALVIFAPLGIYFVTHPGTFMMRASAVATYADAGLLESLKTIGRAALANLAQYVLPGAGDRAQFHNLPGRPIFEPLTALLAVVGLLLALRRWREPRFLFLLLWLIVLTAPAALATDRFPTLPRVLGVIPGLYLLPALGLSGVTAWARRRLAHAETSSRSQFWLAQRRQGRKGPLAFRSGLVPRCEVLAPLAKQPHVPAPLCFLVYLFPCLLAIVLLVPAATTYRDYFRVWGPSAATFDAFEGDMTSAAQWLQTHKADGHVYLSSDIYRHPTFTLLYEHESVQTIFSYYDPNLSMFDARNALPLPVDGQPATYLIGASAALPGLSHQLLPGLVARARVLDPAGQPAVTVLTLPAGQAPITPGILSESIAFSDPLRLTGAGWVHDAEGAALLLVWRTAGPEMADWGGYRLEVVAGAHARTVPFDSFRGTEWKPGGGFITWHRLELPDAPAELRLRLLRAEDGLPVARPDAPDGWHALRLP